MIDNSITETEALPVEAEFAAVGEETVVEEASPALLDALEQYRVKASDYKRDTESISERLTAMQDMTAEVFLTIANKLPAINDGLHGVETEADSLLEYFYRESSFLDEGDKQAAGDLNRLNNASRYLIEIASSQGEALVKIQQMMTRIDNIKASTESIRDFSADMEMLSLNAAIVAIKAGELGRTLNPITDELKKMANTSIVLIDGIVQNSDELVSTYNEFHELTEKQVRYYKADADKNSESLAIKYEGLQTGIEHLITAINGTNLAVREARQSISAIMNALQVQDILRQCTDHIQLALDEAKAEIDMLVETRHAGAIKPEQLLDAIKFQEEVPNLCIRLLLDVRVRLAESAQSLVAEFKRIDSLMAGLNACAVTDASGTLKNSAVSELDESFQEVGVVIAETAQMISNTANSWEQLRNTAEKLTAIMGALEKQFQKLKKSTNFHFINIPVKIEVARSFGQSKDGELAEHVDGLAQYISTELKKSYKDVLESHEFLNQLVVSMHKDKQAVDVRLDSIAADIEDVLGKFNQVKEQVKIAFKGVCQHVGDLSVLVQASLADLDRVSNLADETTELENELRGLVEVARQTKSSLLAVIGDTDWQIHDDRLKGIVEKFTVLSHKKIAESLYDITVEEGNHEGELILF